MKRGRRNHARLPVTLVSKRKRFYTSYTQSIKLSASDCFNSIIIRIWYITKLVIPVERRLMSMQAGSIDLVAGLKTSAEVNIERNILRSEQEKIQHVMRRPTSYKL